MGLLTSCDYFVRHKIKKATPEDRLLENCVRYFKLDQRLRKEELKDEVHFMLEWWKKMNTDGRIKKYKTKSAIGQLIGKNHCTPIHYLGTANKPGIRSKTWNFEENTRHISYFLNKGIVD